MESKNRFFDLKNMNPRERVYLTKSMPPATWHEMLIDTATLARKNTFCSTSVFSPALPVIFEKDTHQGVFGRYDLRLSNEIRCHILGCLLIKDLMRLSLTSVSARSFLNCWSLWEFIQKCGNAIVQALLSSKSSLPWTIYQIRDVILSRDCELCGEHGEIVYLLRLTRCCYRCLASDRRLLAFPLLPHLSPLEVPDLFQFRMIEGSGAISYEGYAPLVDFAQATAWEQSTGKAILDYSASPLRSTTTSAELLEYKTIPSMILPDEYFTVNVHPRLPSIQQRRKRDVNHLLPALQIPARTAAVPETSLFQMACSVHVPVIVQERSQNVPNHGIRFRQIPGKFCAGCAHFWNYHSTLPYQYHIMYDTDASNSLSTPLMQHVSTCIYARLWWNKLYPSSNMKIDYGRAASIIDAWCTGKFIHVCRVPSPTDDEPAGRLFETVPYWADRLMKNLRVRGTAFMPDLQWPITNTSTDEEDINNQSTNRRSRHYTRVHDWYEDSLFSEDALSQSNWACAHPDRSSVSLFHGPLKLLLQRHVREQRLSRKMKEQDKPGLDFTDWFTFDRF